jgi:hypothetical protein
MSNGLTARSGKRARANSFVLLCLMAHALFVCFTHHHNALADSSSLATACVSATGDSDSGNSTDSNGDAHCLSCRLQRNLVSDRHADSFIVAPIPDALSRDERLAQPHSQRFFISFSGRAPPVA